MEGVSVSGSGDDDGDDEDDENEDDDDDDDEVDVNGGEGSGGVGDGDGEGCGEALRRSSKERGREIKGGGGGAIISSKRRFVICKTTKIRSTAFCVMPGTAERLWACSSNAFERGKAKKGKNC